MLSMSESLKQVVTLGNSIIGVSVLAMPYCFKQCGIFLGIVILMASALVTRFNCHLLLKAALLCRRKTYEHLAFHSFGFHGKLAVETSIIGFLLGILISFYVVIGDIAPAIISEFFNVENKPSLRTIILTAVGLGVALPLGLLKTISSLGNISALSFCFYACLIFKIFADAFPILINEKWWQKISFWQFEGTLRCLPIFSLALSCQTQIFEIYDSLPDPSLGKMNKVIKLAVNLCVFVYIAVGFLGYVAFCNDDFSGNVLVNMSNTSLTNIIKLGFVLSVALSFPLVIFPCRTSLCSLLSKKSYTGLDMSSNYVSEFRFKTITFAIVLITLIMGILCPNIELVLGLVGSTIGTIICIVFPALMFIRVTNRNILERYGAQLVFCCGLFLLVACTYVTIHKPDQDKRELEVSNLNQDHGMEVSHGTLAPAKMNVKLIEKAVKPSEIYEPPKIEKPVTLKPEDKEVKEVINENQRRLEPPIPQEPDTLAERKKFQEVKNPENVKSQQEEIVKQDNKISDKTTLKGDIKPEEKIRDVASQQEELLKKIERQQKEQMKLIEEQKHLLEELKAHKESHHKDESENLNLKDESKKIEVESPPEKSLSQKKEVKKESSLQTKEKKESQPLGKEGHASENEAIVKQNNRTVVRASAESKNEILVEKEIEAIPSHHSIKEQSKNQGNGDLEPTVIFQKKEGKDDFKQDKIIHQNLAENTAVHKRDVEVSPMKERNFPLKKTLETNDVNNEKMKIVAHNVSSNKQQFSSHAKDSQKEKELNIPHDVKIVEKFPNVAEKESQDTQSQTVKNNLKQDVPDSILKPNSISIDQVPSVMPKDVSIKSKDAGVWRKDEQK